MEESKRLELLRQFTYEFDEPTTKKWLSIKIDLSTVAPNSYTEKLVQGGIDLPAQFYITLVTFFGFTIGYLAFSIGIFLAVYTFALFAYYFLVTYVDERAQKRRKKMVPQIPSFLDGLTVSLNTGYGLDAALLQGAQSVPEGLLRSELENAVSLLSTGLTVDESFRRLRQRIVGREIISIVTAIDLFASMGGRMLDPFERLSRKLREQERALARADRDLVQIKQAFIIIGALSVLAPLAVFFMQPGYIMGAMNDELGRLILQGALMVEITAIFVFKNMVNLKV